MDPTQAGEFADTLETLGKMLGVQLSGSNIQHAEAVTAGASELAGVASFGAAQMLFVGVSGDVTVTSGGVSLTFTGLAAGVWHPMPPFTHVTSAGAATGILAGY